jgi:hypothetical protein
LRTFDPNFISLVVKRFRQMKLRNAAVLVAEGIFMLVAATPAQQMRTQGPESQPIPEHPDGCILMSQDVEPTCFIAFKG